MHCLEAKRLRSRVGDLLTDAAVRQKEEAMVYSIAVDVPLGGLGVFSRGSLMVLLDTLQPPNTWSLLSF